MSEVMDKARKHIIRSVQRNPKQVEEVRDMERIDPDGLRALADLGVSVIVTGRHGFVLSYKPGDTDA